MGETILYTVPCTLSTANGGLAQLGEHLLCKQGVKGSIPLISTKGSGERELEDSEKKGKMDEVSGAYGKKNGLIAQLVRALG